jgi:TetR/AcrR family transcriptional regulator, cholesterol catabolism regulator
MTKKSERTRQRILDAAASSLAAHGYSSTSLKSIAAAIDMQDASLYYHFASKDDLVLEVLRVGTALAHDAVVEAVADVDLDPVAALRVAIVAHAVAVLGGGDYPRANVRSFGQLPPALAEQHRAQHREYGEVWRGLFEAAIDAGQIRSDLDPTATRLLVLGALNWAIEWYHAGAGLDPAELGDQLATMVLAGALVEGSSARDEPAMASRP